MNLTIYFTIGIIWSTLIHSVYPDRGSTFYNIWAFCLVAALFPISMLVILLTTVPFLNRVYEIIVNIITGE